MLTWENHEAKKKENYIESKLDLLLLFCRKSIFSIIFYVHVFRCLLFVTLLSFIFYFFCLYLFRLIVYFFEFDINKNQYISPPLPINFLRYIFFLRFILMFYNDKNIPSILPHSNNIIIKFCIFWCHLTLFQL